MDLSERLRTEVGLTDSEIDFIKQAFADEGWKDPAFIADNRSFGDRDKLTGAEWYARFEKELRGCVFVDEHDVREAVNQCWDAAKKAAGIK